MLGLEVGGCQMKSCNFDEFVQARLFDNTAPWPMDVSELADFNKTFETLGLVETVPKEPDTWRNTTLGNSINLDLLMVFLGIWDRFEVPWILQQNGLIDAAESERLGNLLGTGADYTALRPAVRRAYARAMDKGVIRWRMN